MNSTLKAEVRCGIILAGGDGQRLRSFVQQVLGYSLPKQYVNFTGNRSMLEHSFRRAQMLLPKERIFTVVSRSHLKHPEVQRQLADRTMGTIVFQPENKDTAPGVLLPLMHVHTRYPRSSVAIFPSDHFILEERLFMGHVKRAFAAVEQSPARLVLLGVQPHEPESEYGYIVPDLEPADSNPGAPYQVRRFIEKPELSLAQQLIRKGGLWNTMVIVSKTATLLDLIRKEIPDTYAVFEEIQKALGAPGEKTVLENLYRQLAPANFSRDFLQVLPTRHPSSLFTLPVRGVFWSDWGLPWYVESALRKLGDRVAAGSETGSSAELLSRISAGSSSWKTA
jgi:mannose-1-phosphate guanylyltransferase